MKALPWVLVVLLILGCVYLYLHPVGKTVIVSDTTKYVDTVKYRKPIPVDSTVIRHEIAILPRYKDTLIKHYDTVRNDSAAVVIPITQKVYKEKEYEAWISGYKPNLDSINTFVPTTIITNTPKIKDKRFGIGISAGYGFTKNGFSPTVSVGVYYRIW